jgi:DNA replication protein DnaC
MIKLKINNKPHLSKINFECDEEIHKKLNEFELTKEFLNKSNTTAFIGRQGSGKTSLMINMIKKLYKKCFHRIFVFMPETSRNSLKYNIFDSSVHLLSDI